MQVCDGSHHGEGTQMRELRNIVHQSLEINLCHIHTGKVLSIDDHRKDILIKDEVVISIGIYGLFARMIECGMSLTPLGHSCSAPKI